MSKQSGDSIEKFKILKSQQNMNALKKMLRKPYLTKHDFKDGISMAGANTDLCEKELHNIDKWFKASPEFANSEDNRNKYENFVRLEAIRKYGKDALTSVGSGSPGDSAFQPYWILKLGERVFTFWIQPGRLGLIIGETGAGKTNWLMYLTELCLEQGYDVVSNVKLKDDIGSYTYCTCLSDMYLSAIDSKERERNVLFGFDEAMTHVPSTKTGGVDVSELENIVALARKYGITIILLLQYKKRAPTIFRNDYHAYFDIESYERMFVDIRLKERPNSAGLEYNQFVSYRPETTMPYDTDAPASFTVDFKVKDALDYVRLYEKDNNEGQREGLKQYLHYVQGKMSIDAMPKLFRKYFAWKSYTEKRGEKIDYRNLGKILGANHQTIKNWIDEMDEKLTRQKELVPV